MGTCEYKNLLKILYPSVLFVVKDRHWSPESLLEKSRSFSPLPVVPLLQISFLGNAASSLSPFFMTYSLFCVRAVTKVTERFRAVEGGFASDSEAESLVPTRPIALLCNWNKPLALSEPVFPSLKSSVNQRNSKLSLRMNILQLCLQWWWEGRELWMQWTRRILPPTYIYWFVRGHNWLSSSGADAQLLFMQQKPFFAWGNKTFWEISQKLILNCLKSHKFTSNRALREAWGPKCCL